jgi:hypothetical protein
MSHIQRLAPSIDLTHRVIEAVTAYTVSRMKILERISGNPLGIAYRKVGDATALSAQNLPSASFNSVVGLRAGQADHIEPLVQWYRDADRRPALRSPQATMILCLDANSHDLGFTTRDFTLR